MGWFGVSDGDRVKVPRSAPLGTPAEHTKHEQEHGCSCRGGHTYSYKGNFLTGYYIECTG